MTAVAGRAHAPAPITGEETRPVEPGRTPRLNAALARVQAEMPAVAKGETGTVEKDGRKLYSYKYADLATCSAAILPLLGRNGLAFIGMPGTGPDGKFGLAYELTHESGECKAGFWPLPSSGTPQQVGSALTYARRYCLCTVTGLAPGGDDDDAAAGNGHQQYDRPRSAAEAFEDAAPAAAQIAARPGQGTRATPDDDPWYTAPAGDWLRDATARAAAFATLDDGRKLWAEVGAKRDAGEITKGDADHLASLMRARNEDLRGVPQQPGGDVTEGTVISGLDPEDPWTTAIDGIGTREEADVLLADLEQQGDAIPAAQGQAIRAAIEARVASLTGATA